MSGKQNTSEASVTRFELKANNAVWELIIGKIFRGEKGEKGERGEKGEDGEAGHTPVKGVDYWTPEDAAAIEAAKKAATDAAARADAAAQQATDKVDKAVADIQIDLDSKQDKLSAENPVQTEQIADNAVSVSKLSAEVATAIGKIPQLEESVSVNNTSIENLGADVQELRENLQEKQDALSAENPVQAEQIADGSITSKKLGADVATKFVEYLPTINDFDEVVGSDVGWKKEDMQRAAQIYASGRVGVSIYDAGGNLPMILTIASDDLEDIGSCFAVLEYHSVLTSGHVESIYMHLDYKEATNKTTVTQFTHLTRLVPRNFVTDDTLNYVRGESDADDTLSIANGGVTERKIADKAVSIGKLSDDVVNVVNTLRFPSISLNVEVGDPVKGWTAEDFNRIVSLWNQGISPRLNVETVPSHVVDVNSKEGAVYIASEGAGIMSEEGDTDPAMSYNVFRTCLLLKDGKVVYGGYVSYDKSLQSAFDVDDSLQYEKANTDSGENAKLGIKDEGVTLPKLSANVQSVIKKFNLPPINVKDSTESGAGGFYNWTVEDFERCIEVASDERSISFAQTTIDGKPAIIDGYNELENTVTFSVISPVSNSSISARTVTIGVHDGVVQMAGESNSLHYLPLYHYANGPQFDMWSGSPEDFKIAFGVDFSVLLNAKYAPVSISCDADGDGKMTTLHAVSFSYYDNDSDGTQTLVFTNGVVFYYVVYEPTNEEITITSKSLLTEGSAPTMAQYNALNDKIGNIDVALTSIIGE